MTSLAFSPDERWLAATVHDGRNDRLLALSVERSAEALRYWAPIGPVERRPGEFGRIAWAPDGNAVVVGSKTPLLINLERETSC